MCWEDIKISRLKKSKLWINSVSGTNIPGNGKRLGFWLSSSVGNLLRLLIPNHSINIDIAFVANSFVLNTAENTSPPIWIGIDEIGDLIYGEFILQGETQNASFAVEVWLDDPPQVANFNQVK